MRILIIALLMFMAQDATAAYFGGQNGRTAEFENDATFSVEANYTRGDFGVSDYQQLGIRLNYRATPEMIIFADLGQSELSSEEETSYGVGAFYSLGQLFNWTDAVAVKASYHQVDFGNTFIPGSGLRPTVQCNGPANIIDPFTLELWPNPNACQTVFVPGGGGRNSGSGEIKVMALEGITSAALSSTLIGRSTSWYLSIGLHMFDGGYSDDTELGLGGGFVFDYTDVMEFYTGFEYIDESSVAFGFRYSIN